MISIEMGLDVILDGMHDRDQTEIIDELKSRHGTDWILDEIERDDIYGYLVRDEVMEYFDLVDGTEDIVDHYINVRTKLTREDKKRLFMQIMGDLL